MSVTELEARTVTRREGAPGAAPWSYVLLGALFGVVLVKSEVASWFRIQEMFRFQSFHMYGIIGSAVAVAAIGVRLVRKTLGGAEIEIPKKQLGRGHRYWIGGTLFGLGWGLLGACPGPIFALIGTGMGVMVVALLAAVLGTWVYGQLRDRLPH
jgi:hypothetical protein